VETRSPASDALAQQDDLVAEIQRLKAEVRQRDEQMLAFRREVGLAASKGKREHGWCNEIDNIMDYLGVPMPADRYRATAEVLLVFDSVLEEEHDETWWRESVQIRHTDSPHGNGMAFLVYLDSDHEEVVAGDFEVVRALDIEAIED
jgi:hypothetical protein